LEKKQKIILTVVASLAVIGAVVYFKSKKPSFYIKNVDWDNKSGVIKFGDREYSFSPYSLLGIQSGEYSLKTEPSSERSFLVKLFKNGQLIDTKNINFNGRIIF
jgi:hypothetical protein